MFSNSKILIYDGSFFGFLTSVFVAFDEKIHVSKIQNEFMQQNGLFSESEYIITDETKANRVWKAINKKSRSAATKIYYAFLSEQHHIEITLYQYIQKLFGNQNEKHLDYSDDTILKVSQITKKVGREKHRMEAFVRFQLTKDHIYFSNIEPDFNVLPLISKHFKNRYADQIWLIYDIKRRYGIYYDLNSVEHVSLKLDEVHVNKIKKNKAFTDEEYDYQCLWNNYFKSTNIKSRVNLKLHTQHVPKRYWKYLSEKK